MSAGRAHRELTAIVLADVVGYSRLVAADETGTLARLEGLRAEILDPLVTEHGGRVVKVMGDGFLLAFASVGEAVACALAWQAAVEARAAQLPPERAIRFRIGVHVGDVQARDGDVLGESVNLAARLQEIAEPGTVYASQTVADHLSGARSVRLEDRGRRALKNIPGRIRVWRVSSAPEGTPTARTGAFRHRARLALMAAAAVAIAAAGAALWTEPWARRSEPVRPEAMAYPLPDKPSIAVLPFANMSDDPEQGYFADGMTEDLITDLAKVSGLFVISRNSVFSYKDRPVEIRQVGEELGVRYVLEGSVRRFGDQVRITGQLIDATNGGHLWAENYDGSVENIFAFQDEVRAKIVDSLEVVLTPAERQTLASAGTHSVEAYEAYLKGMALLNEAQQFSIHPLIEAEGWFKKAIEIDPQYARAMAALAWRDYLVHIYSNDPYTSKLKKVYALAERSLALQETAMAYVVLSKRHFRPRAYSSRPGMGSDYAGAVALIEKARSIEPGSADVLAELAYVLVHAGEVDRAAALIIQAKRLNPSHPVWYRRPSGMIHFFKGDYGAAAEDFQVWRDAEPLTSGDGSLWLAAAQAMDGRTLASHETIAPLRRAWPTTTTHSLSRWMRFADPDMWKAFERGLLAAGIPPE
jgi:adenylate cyclase